jgi:ribonuclease HI
MVPRLELAWLKELEKKGVANANLWGDLDSSIAPQTRIEFTRVKAHSGILPNEYADQMGDRLGS